MKVYLWKRDMNLPDKFDGDYDHDESPDYILFRLGRKLEKNEFIGTFDDNIHEYPTIRYDVLKSELAGLDCLKHGASIPLVSNKLKSLIESLAPDDVEFFEAKVICRDGELEGYSFLNLTTLITSIDHEKSKCLHMKNDSNICGFDYLTYLSGCMGEHKFARDAEYHGNLLVREDAVKAIEVAKMKGVYFVRPEDFYRPITIDDLTGGQAED